MIRRVRYWWKYEPEMCWLAILTVAVLGGTVGVAMRHAQWAAEHHCVKVREISGTTGVGYGYGPNGGGVVTTYEPGKDCYACDDHMEHCW